MSLLACLFVCSSNKGLLLCFRLPGDTRTRVGFLTFDNTIHFYNLQEGLSQPQMLVVSDIDGMSV